MANIKLKRIESALFIISCLIIAWGFIGLILKPITVTLFWGVGIALLLLTLFVLATATKILGFWKSISTMLVLLLIIMSAWILNNYRGWPFGMVYYHDILGWHLLKVVWVVPLFWTLIATNALLLTKPNKTIKDPKVLFAWSFDSAIMVMLYSILIEPLTSQLGLSTWSVQGQVLGVPFTVFLGWFIVAFIASVAAITILKLWAIAKAPLSWHMPTVMMAVHALLLVLVIKANITLLIFFNLIAIVYFAYKIYKQKKVNIHESLNPSFE
ncbi:carotenoid biosynthesis protein [Patescibacteria group bacterium]|nr:carotenoid biosynthesis protein [Patescibacteria group bacterium]